jgi:NAD+ synthase
MLKVKGNIMGEFKFSREVLQLDPEQETERIVAKLRTLMRNHVKRRGLVVGLSGGIDSSVTAALAVRALGASKVFGLEMPERDSAPETLMLSHSVAKTIGIETAYEDISLILDALGCYRRYDDAVRLAIPEYGEGWKSKVVIADSSENRGFSLSSVVAKSPDGTLHNKRLSLEAYRGMVAATNFKQRTRKMLEYYHADRLNFAVAGTPNRLEYDQGFFVKLGDGASDIKPIAHLYKSQVYQMAEYLGVPKEICNRAPTTDTYSLSQGQDEFYFSLPYLQMDLCLYAKNKGFEPEQVAVVAGLTTEQVQHVFTDIATKRSTTRYLHLPAQLVESVPEITPG